MQHKYSFIFIFTALCIGMLLSVPRDVYASLPVLIADTTNQTEQGPGKSSLVDTRNNRPQDIKVTYKPFTPFFFNYRADQEASKVLNNVKVFPTPITDQVTLAFRLNKDSKVTIKIMDALGNEITTLFSQRLSAGDQSQAFMINGKLNSGYYFIRVIAGSETVVKRIQVL